ncbi:MAG TPA: SigB/SigF/SigG family RNA polymerase sigma factor [Acidimicrobiia bacterium]|nr:SigB/SigF/SigG family RNA polymerase sigma factor [Acidimicrobiia bacterium]
MGRGSGEDALAERAELDAQVLARFVEYRRTGDRRLRNALVEEHRGIAERLARQYADRGEPLDDLVQVATLGLLKAVERFDPERGIAFIGFASPTITGELKRHFRDKTWSVRVPRRAQELRMQLHAATDTLHQRLGRTPTLPELAAHLDVSTDDVLTAMEAAAAYRATPMSAFSTDDDRSPIERRMGHDPSADTERGVLLDQLLATLPEREATIVRLRFFEDLTQSEIAAELGISQMHVSRLLRRSLAELRGVLDDDDRDRDD